MENINRIAIIDDGVAVSPDYELIFNLRVNDSLSVVNNRANHLPITHGTVCARIIKRYSKLALFGSISILDNNGRSKLEKLRAAVQWCIDNQIKIINLSLGTVVSADFEQVSNISKKAFENGIFIVAALNNKKVYTLPASLSNAIGVMADPSLKEDEFYAIKDSIVGADYFASGQHDIGLGAITRAHNSYATPLITSKVYEICNMNPQIDLWDVKATLNNQSKWKVESYESNLEIKTHWHINMPEPINDMNTDIPCIILVSRSKCKRQIERINRMFTSQGYNTVCFSSQSIYTKESNSWLLPNEFLDQRYINYIANRHIADIIIIILYKEDIESIKELSCDILFCIGIKIDIPIIHSELVINFEEQKNNAEVIFITTEKILSQKVTEIYQ